jgi:hypothetical protein
MNKYMVSIFDPVVMGGGHVTQLLTPKKDVFENSSDDFLEWVGRANRRDWIQITLKSDAPVLPDLRMLESLTRKSIAYQSESDPMVWSIVDMPCTRVWLASCFPKSIYMFIVFWSLIDEKR